MVDPELPFTLTLSDGAVHLGVGAGAGALLDQGLVFNKTGTHSQFSVAVDLGSTTRICDSEHLISQPSTSSFIGLSKVSHMKPLNGNQRLLLE